MKKISQCLGMVIAGALIAACTNGSSQTAQVNNSTTPGSLALDPPLRIASLNAATFTAELGASTSGAELLAVTGAPAWRRRLLLREVLDARRGRRDHGVLRRVDGAHGRNGLQRAAAHRPLRPRHQHGTKRSTSPTSRTRPTPKVRSSPAMFAAQGYIVVAPNYAGYDISTLGYHPFLNAAQQSGEMMNILAAARTALPKTLSSATSDNGQLFVTGYSEGGHVAMATQRALQAAGATVTAAAPMSGPYALEAFGDALFYGSVDLGSTEFAPLLVASYQHAYGDIYTATTDIFSPTYATGIDTLLPSITPIDTLFTEGLLPETALFDSTTPVVDIPGQAALSAGLTKALAIPSDPTNPDTPLFQLDSARPISSSTTTA